MDSTLETLAPELGWVLFKGEMRWRAKDMAGEKRDKRRGTRRGSDTGYKLASLLMASVADGRRTWSRTALRHAASLLHYLPFSPFGFYMPLLDLTYIPFGRDRNRWDMKKAAEHCLLPHFYIFASASTGLSSIL